MTEFTRNDLFSRVLMSPAADGSDQLRVLSGYASARFMLFHLLELKEHLQRDISVELNIGMAGESGIELSEHLALLAAIEVVGGGWLRVRYSQTGGADHTKAYVWLRNGVPSRAWFGSANYSELGFGLSGSRRETLVETSAGPTNDLISRAAHEFVSIHDPEVFSRTTIFEITQAESRERVHGPSVAIQTPPGLDSVNLPLVQRTKNPGQAHNAGAGLNWGQRGSRRRSEAYIPVPAAIAQSGFFPPRGMPFIVHTTTGETLFLAVAQDGDKALHSVPDNATIGIWFRKKLGLSPDDFVTTEALELFGSKQVTFTALRDGAYLMDFSSSPE